MPIAKKDTKVDDKLDKIDKVEATPVIKKTKEVDVLKVWGDCFNPETLTILASLDYCSQKYEYKEVNMFIGEHK